MDYIQLLGLVAGTFTTIAFIPQVLKTWRSRSARDLSLGMFSIFSLGVALWMIYGIIRNDLPVIIANGVTLLLALFLLFLKIRWKQ
ncbi:MAG: SemiSWEET transporter [Cyclobacteriaceae bacterium]|jgi:MtN3 and saliva related transmembrane protein|nr:SemiSWEET transporter [Cyclobacteriaceae bacterium]